MSDNVRVRLRTDEDVPALIEVLAEQQPHTGYPTPWPPPLPLEDFIHRASEEMAWVAEIDNRVVGHVAILAADDDEIGRAWASAAQTDLGGIACVSVLFVGHDTIGTGVGGRLLNAAVEWARAEQRTPVLDVVQDGGNAEQVYRHRGWQVVGEARPWWLPDDAPPVLLMILPATVAVKERPDSQS